MIKWRPMRKYPEFSLECSDYDFLIRHMFYIQGQINSTPSIKFGQVFWGDRVTNKPQKATCAWPGGIFCHFTPWHALHKLVAAAWHFSEVFERKYLFFFVFIHKPHLMQRYYNEQFIEVICVRTTTTSGSAAAGGVTTNGFTAAGGATTSGSAAAGCATTSGFVAAGGVMCFKGKRVPRCFLKKLLYLLLGTILSEFDC